MALGFAKKYIENQWFVFDIVRRMQIRLLLGLCDCFMGFFYLYGTFLSSSLGLSPLYIASPRPNLNLATYNVLITAIFLVNIKMLNLGLWAFHCNRAYLRTVQSLVVEFILPHIPGFFV